MFGLAGDASPCHRLGIRLIGDKATMSLALQPPDILGQRCSGIELDRKVGIERTAAGQSDLSAGVYMIHSHPTARCVYYGNCLNSVAKFS